MDPVLEGMRLANSTDKEFPCNHCFKPFQDVSQLLRHVSHSNLCLSHYGPDFVKGLREDCRRNSKRKWIALNEESVRQKAKERGRKRNCYVLNSVKHSDMGRAFTYVFRDVFNKYKEQAREDVKMHAKKRYLFLTIKSMKLLMRPLIVTFLKKREKCVMPKKIKGAMKKLWTSILTGLKLGSTVF